MQTYQRVHPPFALRLPAALLVAERPGAVGGMSRTEYKRGRRFRRNQAPRQSDFDDVGTRLVHHIILFGAVGCGDEPVHQTG